MEKPVITNCDLWMCLGATSGAAVVALKAAGIVVAACGGIAAGIA